MKLYTIHCPKCLILERKLKDRNLPVEFITDKEVIANEGLDLMPVLELDDGTRLGFGAAVKWVNENYPR